MAYNIGDVVKTDKVVRSNGALTVSHICNILNDLMGHWPFRNPLFQQIELQPGGDILLPGRSVWV